MTADNMALKTFTLPGKDSRCVRYNGCVYKIKSVMPTPNNRNLSDYMDQASLQEEVEDIIRAILAIPINVEPVVLRTKHLVVKPERKKWELPKKVGFLQDGKVLDAPPFMFVLNLQLIEAQNSLSRSKQIPLEKQVEKCMTSNPTTAGKQERQKRPHPSGDTTIPEPSSKTLRRANLRFTPSLNTSNDKHRYGLRKKSLKLSRRPCRETCADSPHLTPDEVDLGGGYGECRVDKEEGSSSEEEEEETSSSEGEMDVMHAGGGDGVTRGERDRGSPVLESGFSRLAQRNAAKIPAETKRREQIQRHGGQPSTGDLGPSPAKPSDEKVACVGVPANPGREVVEQYVLSEQSRLQQMAATAADSASDSYQANVQPPQHKPVGMVKQMINAVVTPVKNLFSSH